MKHRLILYLCSLFCLLTFGGCRDQRSQASSQAFRAVYSRFDHFNYTSAVCNSLDSVTRIYPNLSFTDKYDYYTFMCGYYHIAKLNDVKALTYTDSLLLLVTTRKSEPANDVNRQASAYLARGGVLFALKKYNSALNYLYQSKVAAERGDNTEIRSNVYYTIGMILFRKLNYNEAAHCFIRSFETADTKQPMNFGTFFRMQEVLSNVSESYMMAGKPDSALLYSDKASVFIDKNESSYKEKSLIETARAVIDGVAGQAYFLKGDTATGDKLLRRSIAVNSRTGYDNGNALQMQLRLAQFCLDRGFESAPSSETVAILKAIKVGLDSIPNEEMLERWNFLMSRYYDMLHDPATALVYLKHGIDYDKKTEADNKALSETNINSYFQALQNEYEMQLLKETNQMEQIYLIISVLLSILCGTIILLIWRHWHHSTRNIEALTRLNRRVKRQKKKLEQTLVTLNARNAEKDHILKVIAHDLRNPISAINALSKLVKEDPTLDTEQNECLDLISKASVESLELIDAIMQMEDSGKTAVNKELRDMNEIVAGCISQFKAQAATKDQTIIIKPSDTPQLALIDTDKIQRVVKNLLSNAIKFSHKGSSVIVSITGKDKGIIISVKDHGIGIPEAMQDKVFDAFTNARRKGTEDEKTFGLGLSICKQFVEAHGGKIWFKSKEGEGTSFYIKLQKEEGSSVIPEYTEQFASMN